MEGIILASRSIIQDKFFKKDQQQKYKRHKETLSLINKQRQYHAKGWEKQVQMMATTLQKSKSAAKTFKQKQQTEHLKEENRNLLKRIWGLQPSFQTYKHDKFQYVSGSNWNQQKKKLQQIKEQNKLIGKKFLINQIEPADYKIKLKREIKQYIQLRDSIRKIKNPKLKRSNSEKQSLTGVKLQKITENVKENDKKQQPKLSNQLQINPQSKV